ncbi:hypothetical protein M2449_003479 [Dysgonomonas sp. PF1-16]|nr:hypothetical protein [Dysgonomonas sp. PF1-16]
MADAPRYVRGTPPSETETITSVADAAAAFGR